MTIYSQHPNRGKTQILATYAGETGVTSSTVTSLADTSLAAQLVGALNRVSALATVPVSVYDRRRNKLNHYPREHLSALVDQQARAGLLEGAYSLWYELVRLRLHDALEDLDKAMATVSAPVQTAIAAELERETTQLRNALTEFSEGIEFPETSDRRYWEFNAPFVTPDAAADVLDAETRESLDRAEREISADDLVKAVADLRLLATVDAQHPADTGMFEPAAFEIFREPYDSDRYYLTVNAPWSCHGKEERWQVVIGRWVPDDPDDEECSSATGETLLSCSCPEAPSAAAIVALLELSEQQAEQLADWAKTPVGSPLAGTDFVVSKHEG